MIREYVLVPKEWLETVLTLANEASYKVDEGSEDSDDGIIQFGYSAAKLVGQCQSAENILTSQHHYKQHLQTLKEFNQ